MEGGKKKEHDLANQILQQAKEPQDYDPDDDFDDGKGKNTAFTGSGAIPSCTS